MVLMRMLESDRDCNSTAGAACSPRRRVAPLALQSFPSWYRVSPSVAWFGILFRDVARRSLDPQCKQFRCGWAKQERELLQWSAHVGVDLQRALDSSKCLGRHERRKQLRHVFIVEDAVTLAWWLLVHVVAVPWMRRVFPTLKLRRRTRCRRDARQWSRMMTITSPLHGAVARQLWTTIASPLHGGVVRQLWSMRRPTANSGTAFASVASTVGRGSYPNARHLACKCSPCGLGIIASRTNSRSLCQAPWGPSASCAQRAPLGTLKYYGRALASWASLRGSRHSADCWPE